MKSKFTSSFFLLTLILFFNLQTTHAEGFFEILKNFFKFGYSDQTQVVTQPKSLHEYPYSSRPNPLTQILEGIKPSHPEQQIEPPNNNSTGNGNSNKVTNQDSAVNQFFNIPSNENLPIDKIKEFQRNAGLNPDGVIGSKTLKAIDNYNDQGRDYTEKTPSTPDCKSSKIEGNESNMIGCGVATNFGSKPDGSKDPGDNGNVLCNHLFETEGKPLVYTYRPDRPRSENLKVFVAALRMQDIRKIFKIPDNVNIRSLTAQKKFCGKWITIKNKNNGSETKAQLLDIMSDNGRVIDLSGPAFKELNPGDNNPKVDITWADQPGATQVASTK
jgi:rare lipoprotein A (peptidoglycan hydrolase)